MLVLALGALIAGSLGAEVFLCRVSLIVVIAGLTVLFLGWYYLRVLLFPLLFLVLMIPIPSIVLNPITLPLQILASKLAAGTLPLFGVPVLRQGNIINLPALSLEVAQACSGLRSLLSLITLAAIYGYFTESITWIRVALMFAAIPTAIGANSLRIVGTGLLVQYWDPGKASGFFHEFSGWLLFLVSVLMLMTLHQIFTLQGKKAEVRGGI